MALKISHELQVCFVEFACKVFPPYFDDFCIESFKLVIILGDQSNFTRHLTEQILENIRLGKR